MESMSENAVRDMPKAALEALGLAMKKGNKTFIIGLHFVETSKETLEDKVKKLIKRTLRTAIFDYRWSHPFLLKAETIS